MSKQHLIPQTYVTTTGKLDAIIEMTDELITGNVARKKASIKGFASRAKEYLIKHT